jgi:hypothetical protein
MNKLTIIVVAGAGLLLVGLTWKQLQEQEAQAEAAKPITVTGYLPTSLQNEFEKRKNNPLLFLEEKKDDREKLFREAPYDEVELSVRGERLHIKRSGVEQDDWHMTMAGNPPVDKNKVKVLLDLFATDTGLMPVKTLSDDDENLRAEYGLDKSRVISITLKTKGETNVSLHVGDRDKLKASSPEQGGADAYDTFVAVPGHPQRIYRAKQKDLRTPLDLKVGELRDKKVFSFDAEDIASIAIEDPSSAGAKKIRLKATWTEPAPSDEKTESKAPAKATAVYELVEPTTADFKLTSLKSYWSSIANLRASEFVLGQAPPAEAELTDPTQAKRLVITLRDASAKPITLLFGAAKEKDTLFYAKVHDQDEYMVLSKYARDNLFKSMDDLRDKNVLGIEKKEEITRIEIRNDHTGDGSLVFERKGAEWQMTSPLAQRPSQTEVKSLASGLQYLRASSFISGVPNAQESGLASPSMEIRVTVKGQERVLRLGAERDSNVITHLVGTSLYFKISGWTQNKFNKKVSEFRNKVVVELSAQKIQKLTLIHSDQTVSLERIVGESNKWQMTVPEQRTAANGLKDLDVNGIVNTVKHFTVKDFSDKTPEQAGLTAPEFSLQAELQDKTTITIDVSGQSQDSQRFVRVKGPNATGEQVYLVDEPKLNNIRKRASDLTKADN